MSEASIYTRILSCTKLLLEKQVMHAQVPGLCGYMGFLPGHVDWVTPLAVGTLTLESKGEAPALFLVTRGYVEYHKGTLHLFVDFLERPEEVDLSRAQKAQARAVERLHTKTESIDMRRALAALTRAQARQRLLQLAGK